VRSGAYHGYGGQGDDLSKRTYHPDRGDIVHLNLSPSAGHELTGPHYALVISTARFSQATGFCIVVPGTSQYHPEQRLHGQQLMVALPQIPLLQKQGWLYPHQVKSIDYRDRGAAFIAKLDDDDVLIDVMDRVRAFIDPDSAT
jgi:mRNA-degrading endonuclease toxin of MazEF toxin-antitoxin module